MMKRVISVLLALLLTLAACASVSAETEASGQLTVGNTTALSGNFTTAMWGSNTADLDVKALLCGYNLIAWDEGLGQFRPAANTVTGIAAADNDDGSRSYYITLYDDLYWSDGSRITAEDYAFSLLLGVMPQVRELGGSTDRAGWIAGLRDWADGGAETVSGIRLLGKNMLKLTVTADYVPFFYELGLLMCDPVPRAVIAPGTEVLDGGKGVYLENAPSAETLRGTLLDAETGYLSHPTVVSGPYTLTSFDGVTAAFDVNPYFKGDVKGQKPGIARLIYTLAENETMIGKLRNGEFGLLNKCLRADVINAGLALTGEGGARMQAYARTGESYIAFMCEKDTVADPAVRQAIAYCLDKAALTAEYSGGYAMRADGYYGLGQWMYMAANGSIVPVDPPKDGAGEQENARYEENLKRLEAITLDGMKIYDPDPAKAAGLLDGAGWTLCTDGLRRKEIGGETVPLDLKLAYPEGNEIGTLLEKYFVPGLKDAGIRLTLTPVPWTELLEQYDRRTERNWDMMYLATNYEVVFDPSPEFDPADAMTGMHNRTAVADAELYGRAADMARTQPGDYIGYLEKWVAFEERFAETLPMIPVYCNTYFDFFAPELQGYAVSSSVTWSQAILDAYLGDPLLEEEPAAEDGDDPIFEE